MAGAERLHQGPEAVADVRRVVCDPFSPKQLSLVYWMTYTLNHHCEFVKSFVRSVIETGNPAWILNTYILFWKRYEGSMSAFDLAFPVLRSLDETFKKLFHGPSRVPGLSNAGIMARVWGQVVLDDSILDVLANSFESLLYSHRKKELETLIETRKFNQFSETIQDFENSERELYRQSHIYTENLYK